MVSVRRIAVCLLVTFTVISCGFAADSNTPTKITYSGKVVDDANKPVDGAKVTLYILAPDTSGQELKNLTTQEQVTKADGSFSFGVELPEKKQYRWMTLFVRKAGFSVGWDNWDLRKDKTTTLSIGKAYTLRGVVVDDANKPIGGAEVRIAMLLIGDSRLRSDKAKVLTGNEPNDFLKTETDAKGIFAFNDIPIEAKAEFVVKKTGRANISTFVYKSSEGYNPGQYSVSSKDIRIIQPVEARIEGKVVDKASSKPVGGVRLMCVAEQRGGFSGVKPVVTKDDGTFIFEGLEAKTYMIQDSPTQAQKETAKCVIMPTKVTTVAGQTSSNVVVEASQGGLLEVTVKDGEKKPVAGANAGIRNKDNNQWQNGLSDTNGIALLRLVPGEYEFQGAYKEGYSSPRERQTITIEDGKTTRLEIELKGAPKISGILTDPTGKPVADAAIKIFPAGQSQDIKSDASGKFEIAWNPERWGGQEPRFILLARHLERNLAAAVDVNEDTKTLDVKMAPGIIITGKVIDTNNKPLAGAQVHVNLRISNWGMYIDQEGIKTDAQGVYEYRALPEEQKYSVSAQADGYGQSYAEAQTDEAVKNRLELEPLTLKLATMSISGVVVDANDKPIPNVEVYSHGQGQQSRRGTTDAQGKFTIDKLCEGSVQVNANVQGGQLYMYGHAQANAGDTDVKVVVSPQGQGRMSSAVKEPPSLKGKPLPDVNSLGIKLDPNDVKDKALLLCFVDMNQRPSRHCFNELAKKYNDLTQKGVVVAAVQIGNANLDLKHAFPLGQIANDEKTRFAWGVKSLPWLVLTDTKHTITAEGFAMSELDEKLKTIGAK